MRALTGFLICKRVLLGLAIQFWAWGGGGAKGEGIGVSFNHAGRKCATPHFSALLAREQA